MKRRNFLTAMVLGALAGLGGVSKTATAQAPVATTVIVVRHAEKANEPAGDPALTAAGKRRAEALAAALKDAGVTAVITTQYRRTRETAQPTADEFHLTPEVVTATGSVADHAAKVAEAVMLHAGGTILVVDHSNMVPAIVAALGAPKPAAMCESEYDRLTIVNIAWGGKATAITARYGQPTVAGKDCASAMMKP